jgi:hypothetical protein
MADTKTKKQTAPGKNGANVTDIDHEEITQQPGAMAVRPTVITAEDQIKLELAKFNVADSAIAKMKEDYGALTIADADDKTGYKAVREAWSEVRSKRTGLEKKGLELRNQYKVITTAIGKEEDRLVDLLKPLEDDLYKKWKDIDEEKERVKKEAEEAERAELMNRIEELQTLGMVFSDGFYRVGDAISMDVATLRALPVEQFDKLKTAVISKVAEIKEAERKEAERKQAEADELQRQQDKLKADQDKLAEQQRQFQEQQDQLKRDQEEAARLKLDMRLTKLEALGMARQGNYAMKFDIGFNGFTEQVADISALEEAAFATFLDETATHIKQIQNDKAKHEAEQERERQAKEEREKFIAEQMESAGMAYEYSSQSFVFVNKIANISLQWNDFAGMDDDQIRAQADEISGAISKAKKLAFVAEAKEKKAKQKEEQLALSDNEKFKKIFLKIEEIAATINADDFKTKKSQERATNLRENLFEFLNKNS